MGASGFDTQLRGTSTGAIAEIISIAVDGQDATVIDTSTMNSTNGWKTKVPGMKDAGQLTLEIHYDATEFAAIQSALGSAEETWTITFPDDATFIAAGFVQSFGAAFPHDDGMTQSVTIELSGEPAYTA